MSGQDSIILRIDRELPISLEQLTFGMMAIGAEYDRYIRDKHPDSEDHESDLLVRRVSEGSIVIELIGALLPVLQGVDNILTFIEFIKSIERKIGALSKPGGRLENATTKELANMTRMAETIVGDSKGTVEVFAMEYLSETEDRRVAAKVMFKARDAEKVIENAATQMRTIKDGTAGQHQGLLMRLYQTNIAAPTADRSSGEKGIIEALSPTPKRLIYASDLAGQKIKNAWADEGVSPYELGFVVDVDVQAINGSPRAYRILDVHDVFPLNENED